MIDSPDINDKNQDNNNLNHELTVKQVANIIEETPNVVRNWIKELKMYIPIKKNASGYNVFDQEALEVMKEIKRMHRERNYSIKQIEHYFATGGKGYTPIPEKSVEDEFNETLQDIQNRLNTLQEDNKQQLEFNQALLKKLDDQQKYIENRLEERDELLLRGIRGLQETKSLEAAAEEEKKTWWKFWK